MAVFRIEKSSDYTVMSNHHLRNHALSLKAKGLLSQMLSLPEDWDYTLAGLAEINKESKDAIRSAVEELEQAGYIQRRQTQDKTGKFSGNEYVIREMPAQPYTEQDCPPDVDNDGEQPELNAASPLLDFPTTENPSPEKPLTENPTELNKDISSKDNIIPPKAPQGGDDPSKPKKRRGDYKARADVLPERFEKFWTFYRTNCPLDANPGNRQKAIRAWDKLAPSDDLATDMARALAKQVRSAAWKKGVGVPHASTWINNHGWEDDWGSAGEETQIPDSPGEEAAEWVT